jgi:hypothetical protein
MIPVEDVEVGASSMLAQHQPLVHEAVEDGCDRGLGATMCLLCDLSTGQRTPGAGEDDEHVPVKGRDDGGVGASDVHVNGISIT